MAGRSRNALSLPEPAHPTPVSASTPAGGGAPARPDAPLRILLAEDSEDNRLLVRSILRDHVLDEAADGESAVGKFTSGRYDIVLMDVQMPVLDGYAATEAMRAWERAQGRPPTPILAFTAHALPDEIQRSFDAGCNDHLTKPIRRAALLAAIDRHVPGRAASAGPPAGRAVRLILDEALRDLAPGYLDNRRRDLAPLAAALASGDWETLRVRGHNMKGTGAGYGFDAITAIGAALEAAARDRDGARAREQVDALGRFLGSVVLEFRPGAA